MADMTDDAVSPPEGDVYDALHDASTPTASGQRELRDGAHQEVMDRYTELGEVGDLSTPELAGDEYDLAELD